MDRRQKTIDGPIGRRFPHTVQVLTMAVLDPLHLGVDG
jgi:hypothetical protein